MGILPMEPTDCDCYPNWYHVSDLFRKGLSGIGIFSWFFSHCFHHMIECISVKSTEVLIFKKKIKKFISVLLVSSLFHQDYG